MKNSLSSYRNHRKNLLNVFFLENGQLFRSNFSILKIGGTGHNASMVAGVAVSNVRKANDNNAARYGRNFCIGFSFISGFRHRFAV